MDAAPITEILTDPVTLDLVERQPIMQIAYDSMVRIVVTPAWVRLNDFQRTAPRAVERLVQAKQG
jgi:hypothetical protein